MTATKGLVSIVIPAKDEKEGLAKIIPQLMALYPVYELIVVDDGSTDDTRELLEQYQVNVVRHPYSKGNGAAIKSGARAATGEILVFLDGDGQHDPRDVGRLVEKIEEGYDLVVGARQSGSQASFGRAVANALYNFLARYMTSYNVKDLTSGLRSVRADKFREFLYLLPNGFSYPTTSTMAFFRAGYAVCYIPIETADRAGKSHIRPLKDGLRFLLIIFKIGTLYSPLKLFAPTALLLFGAGIGWYAYTFSIDGRFTNMSALLITGAVMTFMMGLISEQITALMYKDRE